jgi:Uma2 family endonuclease
MAQRALESTNLTVEEFMTLDVGEDKAELVRGELRLTPPADPRHGAVAVNLAALLHRHVMSTGIGRVFAEICYELVQLPRTVRAPDVSFVRAERLPASGIGSAPFNIVPDLAVEILSPSDTASRLDEKLDDYAASRVPLVWVIDPERRTVRVIAVDAPVRSLRDGDMLDGGSIIPGFVCPVSEVFAGLDGNP